MKSTLSILTLLLLFFPSTMEAHWMEEFGFNFTPNNTYYAYDYLWTGTIKDYSLHGNVYSYHYYTYNTYEKNGKTYLSVVAWANSQDASFMILLPGPTIIMGFRQEDGRIYVDKQEYVDAMEKEFAECQENQKYNNIPLMPVSDKDYIPYKQTPDGELILYDFNMQPGDKYLSVEGHDDISVVSVYKMTTKDGIERRLLKLSNGYRLLEGVGCLNSPGMFFYYLNPSEVMTHYYSTNSLRQYSSFGKNEMIIYDKGDELSIGIIEKDAVSDCDAPFYNLQGRRIDGQPKRGVYIKEGRKVLIK